MEFCYTRSVKLTDIDTAADPASSPGHYVDRYSADELDALMVQFSPLAADRRRRRIVVFGGVFISFLISLVFVIIRARTRWLWLPPGVMFAGVGLSRMLLPPLRCPGCNGKLDVKPAEYCPECGASSLERVPGTLGVTCTRDNHLLRRSKRRNYKIHACTHCGVWLDDEGF